jgi:hypothetical protein
MAGNSAAESFYHPNRNLLCQEFSISDNFWNLGGRGSRQRIAKVVPGIPERRQQPKACVTRMTLGASIERDSFDTPGIAGTYMH